MHALCCHVPKYPSFLVICLPIAGAMPSLLLPKLSLLFHRSLSQSEGWAQNCSVLHPAMMTSVFVPISFTELAGRRNRGLQIGTIANC